MRAILLFVVLLLASCTQQTTNNTTSTEPTQQPEQRVVAKPSVVETFIIQSGTYSFDGKDLKLQSRETSEDFSFYTYTFTSSHDGYGDRTNKTVLAIDTPHVIKVILYKDGVASAIIDNEWNELTSKPVSASRTNRLLGDTCEGEDRMRCGTGLSCVRYTETPVPEGVCIRVDLGYTCTMWKSDNYGVTCFKSTITPSSEYSQYTPLVNESYKCVLSLQGDCRLES